MATLAQIETALRNADAAGDTEAATQLAAAYRAAKSISAQPPEPAPDPTGSFGENVMAGVGRAFTRGGRAIKQVIDVPAQALERTFGGQRVSRALGMPTAAESAAQTQANLSEAEVLDQPLMATKGGRLGDFAGNVAMFVPTMAIPGANTVTGAALIGGAGSALTTPGSIAERGTAGAFGAAGGAGGQFVGQKVGKWAGDRIAAKRAAAVSDAEQNAVRDATLAAGREAGYVVPPSTVRPTYKNRVLESISGKIQTERAASVKNQAVTDDLIRQDLGLKKGAPLTIKTLNNIRKDQGLVYDEVSKAGRIAADDTFKADMRNLSAEADRINIDFPDLPVAAKDDIVKLTNALSRDSFDAKSAAAAIKSLRANGSKNMSGLVAAANPEKAALGRAQLAAAEAVEDQLKRHLELIGKGKLADDFDKARTLIAKTYSVQNALNEQTGHVAAGQLSKQLKKGKYLSGGTEAAGRFAGAFPKATQTVQDSAGVHALDIPVSLGVGGIGAMSDSYSPWLGLAYPVGRYAARNALLSRPGQRLLAQPRYQPTNALTLRATRQIGRLGLPLGATAGIGYAEE